MRTVYNISDRLSPLAKAKGRKAPAEKTVLIGTQKVPPGRSVQVPDGFQLRKIAALVAEEFVSVDSIPVWYQTATRAATDAAVPAPEPTPEPEDPEPVAEEEPTAEELKRGRKKRKKKTSE